MGLRAWSERTQARLNETADRLDAKSKAATEELDAERAARQDAALEQWRRACAAELGVDHDDLARRSAALGIELPTPKRSGRVMRAAKGVRRATSHVPGVQLAYALEHQNVPQAGDAPTPYELWCTRVEVEERVGAKLTGGGSLSIWDRVALRAARGSYP